MSSVLLTPVPNQEQPNSFHTSIDAMVYRTSTIHPVGIERWRAGSRVVKAAMAATLHVASRYLIGIGG